MNEQSEKSTGDREKVSRDPASSYSSPLDVVEDPRLTMDEKVRLLRQWERDARSLAVAEEENMGGGESVLLSSVLDALRCLGAGPDATDVSKH